MKDSYDIGIIGGGLAGLALSIQAAHSGHTVILLEKEQYPFHRVCGEYISMESWDFLLALGVDLASLKVPVIRQLQLSGKNGKILQQPLPLGGFGISRYTLDATLVRLARNAGVTIEEDTKVTEVVFMEDEFIFSSDVQQYRVKVAAGSFGKRSNLDIKWKRPFATAAKNKLNNYVGVKYHVNTPDFPSDTIALHLFDNGYCGIVKVEGGVYNICYLTTARNLQKSGGIEQMEQTILSANPQLQQIFSNAQKLWDAPVTISQISFDRKSQVEDHVLMIGDAAGMITPLCGNGMSMALHASKLAADQVNRFLEGNISRAEMEEEYTRQWQKQFASRLLMGRRIQRLFSNQLLTYFFIWLGRVFPGLIRLMIKQTHGKPF
jgi:flavin-dependent dehydrogenase